MGLNQPGNTFIKMLGFNIKQHPWNVTPAQARRIQLEPANKVITKDRLGQVRYVAGVDVGFENNNTITCAAVAVLRFPELQLHEYAIAHKPTSFPYVPGLLSFREIPTVVEAPRMNMFL